LAGHGAIVITGASTGIGRACALCLDRMGFRVFAGVRRAEDRDSLKRQASERLTPVMLDVMDAASIAAAADLVAGAVGKAGLWGLVNNAGIVVPTPLEFIPLDEFRRQLEVNVTGQIAVTQALLPLLRKARGRIVNIGSISGRMPFPLLGPYCASKFALEAVTATLRMELRPWGVHVCIIEPGGISTPIWEKGLAAGEDLALRLPPEAHQLYGPLLASMRRFIARPEGIRLPPERVARVVAHALTAKKPKTRYMVGRTAWLGEIMLRLPERVRERLITSQLGW